MGLKDPVKKAAYQKQWNDKRIAAGYGKVLYGRRGIRLANEKRYRAAIEQAVASLEAKYPAAAKGTLLMALAEADKAAQKQEKKEREYGITRRR